MRFLTITTSELARRRIILCFSTSHNPVSFQEKYDVCLTCSSRLLQQSCGPPDLALHACHMIASSADLQVSRLKNEPLSLSNFHAFIHCYLTMVSRVMPMLWRR